MCMVTHKYTQWLTIVISMHNQQITDSRALCLMWCSAGCEKSKTTCMTLNVLTETRCRENNIQPLDLRGTMNNAYIISSTFGRCINTYHLLQHSSTIQWYFRYLIVQCNLSQQCIGHSRIVSAVFNVRSF